MAPTPPRERRHGPRRPEGLGRHALDRPLASYYLILSTSGLLLALAGAVATGVARPAVPVTAAQIVESAIACVDAGAAAPDQAQ